MEWFLSAILLKMGKHTWFLSQLLSNSKWEMGFYSCHKTKKKGVYMFGAMLCQHYICLYVINAKLICQILKGFPVPKISKPTEPTLVYIWLKLNWMAVLPTDSDSKVMFLLLETDKHVFKVHMTWNIIAVYLKGQNDTCYAAAMTTLLPLVLS